MVSKQPCCCRPNKKRQSSALTRVRTERGRELRQSALGRTITGITRCPSSLDSRAHRVENVTRHAILLLHDRHGHLGAQEYPQQVHLDDGFHLRHRHIPQISSSTVDSSIVDPVTDRAQILLGKRAELFHVGSIRYVALCVVDIAVRMSRFQRSSGRGAIFHVANHHVVAAVHELARVGKADATGRPGDDNSRLLLNGPKKGT